MRKTRIIPADLSHLDVLARLFNDYRIFYQRPPDLEGARQYLAARLQNKESVIFLAQDVHGRSVGFVQLYPTWASLSMAATWVLYDLYVVPAARRQGVARALLRRAARLGRESGAHSLSLETAIDNLPAQKLYESMGWQREVDYFQYFLELDGPPA